MESEEQRIWQRVFGRGGEEQVPPPGQLVYLCRQSLAVYRKLLPEARGRNRQFMRQLLEGESENLACLRGLESLRGLGIPETRVPVPNNAREALRQCWERSAILLREYTARSALGSSGPVYRQMALRQERCCALLAALLGQMKG